ncbi:hypothetical protein N0V88_000398 [Collariella sp. IMI 366227]|nr:hypothetical protein N0V88_000398 [Collariella sp. IMI 366227]
MQSRNSLRNHKIEDMAQPIQTPFSTEATGSEKIPPLTNIAPSIFVPLRDDLLNTDLPQDRVERLKRILETIDYQKQGVKANLIYMFEREKRRTMQHAAELEAQQGPSQMRPSLPPDEADEIIANMEAPARPDLNYNIRDMPQLDVSRPIPPAMPLRERTLMELLVMVERGFEELQGYEAHIVGIKQHYLERLERELASLEDAGKRPEERSGGKEVWGVTKTSKEPE